MTQRNRADSDFYDSNAYKIIHIQPFVAEIWPLQVTTSEVAHFDVIRPNYDANGNKCSCLANDDVHSTFKTFSMSGSSPTPPY